MIATQERPHSDMFVPDVFENPYNYGKPHVAFFGPTGGCALAALIHCLRNGYTTVALSRSSEKLIKLLDQRGVPPNLYIEQRLRIVEGDVTDPYAVKEVFSQKPVGVIVFGIGVELPHTKPLAWMSNVLRGRNKTLSHTAVATILSCIPCSFPPPLFIAISTTGIDPKRDVPLWYLPLYSTVLRSACKDKAAMEAEIIAAEGNEVVAAWVLVRPALMSDPRENLGRVPEVKIGEGVVGYGVTRQAVGDFVWECVRDGAQGGWVGKKVCVSVEYR